MILEKTKALDNKVENRGNSNDPISRDVPCVLVRNNIPLRSRSIPWKRTVEDSAAAK